MGPFGSVKIHQHGFGRDGLFTGSTNVLSDWGRKRVLAMSAGYPTLYASGLHCGSGVCAAFLTSNKPLLHCLVLFLYCVACFFCITMGEVCLLVGRYQDSGDETKLQGGIEDLMDAGQDGHV